MLSTLGDLVFAPGRFHAWPSSSLARIAANRRQSMSVICAGSMDIYYREWSPVVMRR